MTRNMARAPSQRQRRVAELIRQNLAELLITMDFGDPDIDGRLISVHGVEISPDLRIATLFVMPMGGPQEQDRLLKALSRNKATLRRHLSRNMATKYLPDLRFRFDEGLARLEEIDRLLNSDSVKRDLIKEA